jgi:hypothetical protein
MDLGRSLEEIELRQGGERLIGNATHTFWQHGFESDDMGDVERWRIRFDDRDYEE